MQPNPPQPITKRRGCKPTPLAQRLLPKFVWVMGCWGWTAAINKQTGYGAIGRGGRKDGVVSAHVAMYEVFYGPVPEGMELDHLCQHRWCVRPSHLEPVTHLENVRRSPHCPRHRTACPRGHAYDIIRANGERWCSVCQREWSRRAYWKRKAA